MALLGPNGIMDPGTYASMTYEDVQNMPDNGFANATAEDIALICHAHPTLSESIKEAASLASYGHTIHS